MCPAPRQMPSRRDAVCLGGAFALTLAPMAAVAAAPAIHVAGPDEQVIPADAFNRCVEHHGALTLADTPDAPPALVVHPDGSRLLFAVMSQNVPFVAAPGGGWLRPGCNSVLPSRLDADPGHFAYQTWLAATWSRDGRHVFGLGHDEWHGWEVWPTCRARVAAGANDYGTCLRISLSGYQSGNGGFDFTPISGQNPLAAPAAAPTLFNSIGFTRARIGDPSNLATNPHDGYTYFLAMADGEGQPQRGTCVFRARDPFAGPWFTWDGGGFNQRTSGPDAQPGCTPVRPWGLVTQALTFNTVIDAFIAIGQSDDHHLVAQTSHDLVHWSAPIALRISIQPGWYRPGQPGPTPAQYFSLNDPDDPRANMGISGGHPYLYYVSYPVGTGRVNYRLREVWRVPLSVAP